MAVAQIESNGDQINRSYIYSGEQEDKCVGRDGNHSQEDMLNSAS